jgi:hypothetical protein
LQSAVQRELKVANMQINSPIGRNAQDVFPDLVSKKLIALKNCLAPPPAPDISWLKEGPKVLGANTDDYVHAALLFLPAVKEKVLVEKILGEMEYKVKGVLSAENAIQKLRAFQYNLIICTTDAAARVIHEYICILPSARRRVLYYVIVGPHLHTLSDLEALAFSANLVVNNKELKYLQNILIKGFLDYENLFGPLLDVVNTTTFSM